MTRNDRLWPAEANESGIRSKDDHRKDRFWIGIKLSYLWTNVKAIYLPRLLLLLLLHSRGRGRNSRESLGKCSKGRREKMYVTSDDGRLQLGREIGSKDDWRVKQEEQKKVNISTRKTINFSSSNLNDRPFFMTDKFSGRPLIVQKKETCFFTLH